MVLPARFHKLVFGLTGMTMMLSGCGFHPMYGGSGAQNVSAKMKDVYVASMPNRFGQQLRQYLQQHMAGDGPENPHGYTLAVNPSLNEEAIDIHQDNTSGRTRVIGSAHWTLYTLDTYPVKLAEGDATTVDGYNVIWEQYFAQSLNDENVQGRVAQNLADEVSQQVATWFNTHAPLPKKEETADDDQVKHPGYQLPGLTSDGRTGAITQQPGADGLPALATGRQEIDPLAPR